MKWVHDPEYFFRPKVWALPFAFGYERMEGVGVLEVAFFCVGVSWIVR